MKFAFYIRDHALEAVLYGLADQRVHLPRRLLLLGRVLQPGGSPLAEVGVELAALVGVALQTLHEEAPVVLVLLRPVLYCLSQLNGLFDALLGVLVAYRETQLLHWKNICKCHLPLAVANEVSPSDDLDDGARCQIEPVFVVRYVREDRLPECWVDVVASLMSGLYGLAEVFADRVLRLAVVN